MREQRQKDKERLQIGLTAWVELSVMVMMMVEGPVLRRPRQGGLRTQRTSTQHLLAHLGPMIPAVQLLFEAVSLRA